MKRIGRLATHVLFAVKLTLAQVYSALAYADENRAEIETDFAEQARVVLTYASCLEIIRAAHRDAPRCGFLLASLR